MFGADQAQAPGPIGNRGTLPAWPLSIFDVKCFLASRHQRATADAEKNTGEEREVIVPRLGDVIGSDRIHVEQDTIPVHLLEPLSLTAAHKCGRKRRPVVFVGRSDLVLGSKGRRSWARVVELRYRGRRCCAVVGYPEDLSSTMKSANAYTPVDDELGRKPGPVDSLNVRDCWDQPLLPPAPLKQGGFGWQVIPIGRKTVREGGWDLGAGNAVLGETRTEILTSAVDGWIW